MERYKAQLDDVAAIVDFLRELTPRSPRPCSTLARRPMKKTAGHSVYRRGRPYVDEFRTAVMVMAAA